MDDKKQAMSFRFDAARLARSTEALARLAPGFLLSAIVAAAAFSAAPWVAPILPIPAMVLALVIGIALSRIATRPEFQPGLAFCVRQVLRWAVALLGLRIALGDIAALGITTAGMVVISMTVTIFTGILLSRLLGLHTGFGALAGAGTAVCGASAALATSSVLPEYRGKEADLVFVVVAVNALSTLAMVLYPSFSAALGFGDHVTGILIGATIHDVAQVVGAGYAISDSAGNTAVIVKLFRVFLLLPIVTTIGWWFGRKRAVMTGARVPIPIFALMFLGLCVLNSIALPGALVRLYIDTKSWLIMASTGGLLIAIAALGLGTSVSAVSKLGWRHVATVSGTTLMILVVVTALLGVTY